MIGDQRWALAQEDLCVWRQQQVFGQRLSTRPGAWSLEILGFPCEQSSYSFLDLNSYNPWQGRCLEDGVGPVS